MSGRWIAFDAAGTLIRTSVPVETTYAECFSALGFPAPEKTWKSAFRTAFSLAPDPEYEIHETGDRAERTWWRTVVAESAHATGIRPSRETMDTAFETLFDHYASGSAWELFPEVEQVLRSFEEQGLKMAVVSNFDLRLHRILDELGTAGYFETILTSADAAARKPSPDILHLLVEGSGIVRENGCLVGDSLEADGGAANSMEIPFYHLDRPDRTLVDFADWHRSLG